MAELISVYTEGKAYGKGLARGTKTHLKRLKVDESVDSPKRLAYTYEIDSSINVCKKTYKI